MEARKTMGYRIENLDIRDWPGGRQKLINRLNKTVKQYSQTEVLPSSIVLTPEQFDMIRVSRQIEKPYGDASTPTDHIFMSDYCLLEFVVK